MATCAHLSPPPPLVVAAAAGRALPGDPHSYQGREHDRGRQEAAQEASPRALRPQADRGAKGAGNPPLRRLRLREYEVASAGRRPV